MAIDGYLNLITSQHRNKPNLIAWLSSALNKVDDGITATNSIPSVFSISGAKLGTTNFVKNSGVEVVTQTATLFSDALTSYTGSTVPAPWTLQSGGSVTFGTGGATIGTTGSVLTAGNASWKPLLGSDGTTKLAVSAQVETTTPSVIPSTGIVHYGQTYLWVDAQNYYVASLLSNGGASSIYLSKNVKGTGADIAWAAITLQASTKYTVSLTLSSDGTLTASATPSGGSVVTATKVDTDLTSGFLIGIGADSGYTLSNASVTAPWANSWTIGGDSRVAWGLTQSAIGGKYSVSAVGVASGVQGVVFPSTNITGLSSNTSYTFSLFATSSNLGSSGFYGYMNWYNGSTYVSSSPFTQSVTGTTSEIRVYITATSPSNATAVALQLRINDSGTIVFDNIQLEQGSTATNYVDNPSLSYPASTYSDQLNVIGQSIGADRDVGVQLSTGTSILDDAHYQTYLNAKISANQWDGTTPGLYKIWSSVFPGFSLKITDNQDMTISLTISGITDSVVEEMINDGLIIPKPMGVKISSITFGTVLIYNKLDTQTWNTVQTYTWDQLEMQSF